MRLARLVSLFRTHGVPGALRLIVFRLVIEAVKGVSLPARFGGEKDDPTNRIFEEFLARANAIKAPRILELGSRNISHRHHFKNPSEYVGFDINPGTGVDMVGDAHALSRHFPADHFDVVYAISVFEHLSRPLTVAEEIHKVLKPGGIVFVFTHHTFPLHAEPWDFWRFSRHAFHEMFGPRTGYEIVSCEQGLPCVVLPLQKSEATRWTHRVLSFMGVSVLARKLEKPQVADPDVPPPETYPVQYSDDVNDVFMAYCASRRGSRAIRRRG